MITSREHHIAAIGLDIDSSPEHVGTAGDDHPVRLDEIEVASPSPRLHLYGVGRSAILGDQVVPSETPTVPRVDVDDHSL
jgi:hypothetical protein